MEEVFNVDLNTPSLLASGNSFTEKFKTLHFFHLKVSKFHFAYKKQETKTMRRESLGVGDSEDIQ